MKPIALPKHLETKVVQVARRLRKPRQVILREAIDEYAARHDQEAMTAAANQLAREVDTHLDPGLSAATNKVLARTEW